MKWFDSAAILSAILSLAGCSNNEVPPSSPPVNPPPPSETSIEVQAPGGVDVKAGKDRIEVKAPGTDVEVERKK